MPLNDRQRAFVQEYLVDMNGAQAAIRAGYSAHTARHQAARLLAHANIKAELDKGRAERAQRTQITADKVLEELAKIGFANIGDFVTMDGGTKIEFSDVRYEQLAALSSVETEERFERDEDGDFQRVVRTKVKLWDKRAALVDIGKHLGMFTEKFDMSGSVKIVIDRDDADL